jgi:diketogulonate reductase-like aldo/keto reductase
VVAYSPFGHVGGFPELRSAGGRVLKAIADRQEATPRQVALRFLTRRASLFAIPKAADLAHAEENAGALSLSAAELAKIEAAFPLGARRRPLPML